jgi:amino acid adenylation domain-containing protein
VTGPPGGPGFVEFPRADLELPIGALFERQAARHPHRVAVESRRQTVTYAELDAAANRVAGAVLRRRGPGNEPIALLFEHDAPVLAAILGALKAGKIYVALDPHQSGPRLAAILADSEAPLIVCDAAHLARGRELAGGSLEVLDATALGGDPAEPPGLPVAARTPACIYYTSGSTGEAKGVVGDHRYVTHRTMVFVNNARVTPADRLGLTESVGVGGSVRALYGALLTGAAVVPFDPRAEGVDAIAAWLADQRITLCGLAASVFRHVAGALPAGPHFPALRHLAIGRETVAVGDIELHRTRLSPGCVLINLMGSAETGTLSEMVLDATTRLDEGGVPVGYPIPDKNVLLIGDDGEPAPPGEPGEIVVRSEFLALGYWRRPDLDAKVFFPDPRGGAARLCRTGDLGRFRDDGCLIHLGRKDARAKVRGQRVDLAGIESVLREHPGVQGAVASIREDRPGVERLVAHVVPAAAGTLTVGELQALVRDRLGTAAVPSAFGFVDALPLAPNGKVDRRALPAPPSVRPPLATTYVAPRSPVEEAVARIWAEALDVDAVGIHDDFLELGGTSLLAGRITSAICAGLGVEIPAPALLEAPRVADMAAVVVGHLAAAFEPAELDGLLRRLGDA